jgi:hypothetical protein
MERGASFGADRRIHLRSGLNQCEDDVATTGQALVRDAVKRSASGGRPVVGVCAKAKQQLDHP